jgi:hypothetical protein
MPLDQLTRNTNEDELKEIKSKFIRYVKSLKKGYTTSEQNNKVQQLYAILNNKTKTTQQKLTTFATQLNAEKPMIEVFVDRPPILFIKWVLVLLSFGYAAKWGILLPQSKATQLSEEAYGDLDTAVKDLSTTIQQQALRDNEKATSIKDLVKKVFKWSEVTIQDNQGLVEIQFNNMNHREGLKSIREKFAEFYSNDTLKIACRSDTDPFEKDSYYFKVTQRIEVTFPIEKLDSVEQGLTTQSRKMDEEAKKLNEMARAIDARRDQEAEASLKTLLERKFEWLPIITIFRNEKVIIKFESLEHRALNDIRAAFTPFFSEDNLKIECGDDRGDRRTIYPDNFPYIQITFPIANLETFKGSLELSEGVDVSPYHYKMECY